jgi:hypothetical protein
MSSLGLLLCAIFLHAQTAPQRTKTAAPEPLPSTVKFNRDNRPIRRREGHEETDT